MRSIKEVFKIHFLKTNEGYYFYVVFVTGIGSIGSGVAAAVLYILKKKGKAAAALY